MVNYEELFLRNKGYISSEVQEKIRKTRLLIAGCGIGSTIAEAAARMGFGHMTLADGDTVEIHNLNRQAFSVSDVGKKKVAALSKRLRAINPGIVITEFPEWISPQNVASLVGGADFIFDTIDFLDLKTIVAVHDEANRQGKPVISAVSAGWGAAGVYVPPDPSKPCAFRHLFGLPSTGPVENKSYVQHFAKFMQRIGAHLDPSVAQAMAKALTIMEDGTPCPAPHVSAGSFSVASLCVTMAYRILAGEKIATAPHLILVNVGGICAEAGIDLTPYKIMNYELKMKMGDDVASTIHNL
jgi:molybdopterin-synthase adenylyltransferase